MSKIDKHNYEAFLLDSMEGTLTTAEEKELRAFLAANPDLAAATEDFEAVELKPTSLSYPDKSELKHALLGNEEEQIIAYHEGDLTIGERIEMEKTIAASPEKEHAFNLYGKLFLTANELVVYPDKKKLKKRAGLVVRLYPYVAAAAAIALILFLTRDEVFEKEGERPIQSAQLVKQPIEPIVKEAEPIKKEEESVAKAPETVQDVAKQAPVEILKKPLSKSEEVVREPVLAEDKPAQDQIEPSLIPEVLFVKEDEIRTDQKQNNEEDLAQVAEKSDPVSIAEAPGAGKVLRDRLVGRIVGEDEAAASKMDGHAIASVMADKIAEKTGRIISYSSEKDENDDVIAYSFHLGKFGVETIRGKK